MNGKGDTPRPLSVPREEYESAWARTFGPRYVRASNKGSAKCAHFNKQITLDGAECSDCGAELVMDGAGGT